MRSSCPRLTTTRKATIFGTSYFILSRSLSSEPESRQGLAAEELGRFALICHCAMECSSCSRSEGCLTMIETVVDSVVTSECTDYDLPWPMNQCDSPVTTFNICLRLATSQPCTIINTSPLCSCELFTNALDTRCFQFCSRPRATLKRSQSRSQSCVFELLGSCVETGCGTCRQTRPPRSAWLRTSKGGAPQPRTPRRVDGKTLFSRACRGHRNVFNGTWERAALQVFLARVWEPREGVLVVAGSFCRG